MVAWIKMALSIEVSLGPGDFVLDGDLAPSPKREQSPLSQFSAIDASRCHLVWR